MYISFSAVVWLVWCWSESKSGDTAPHQYQYRMQSTALSRYQRVRFGSSVSVGAVRRNYLLQLAVLGSGRQAARQRDTKGEKKYPQFPAGTGQHWI